MDIRGRNIGEDGISGRDIGKGDVLSVNGDWTSHKVIEGCMEDI